MKIMKSGFAIRFPKTKQTMAEMLMLVEEAARLCYQSEAKDGENFDAKFIRKKVDAGHESVIEHSMISVRVICDRGVSHEIVRHRLASYSQESTRYCNYGKDKFEHEIKVIDLATGFCYDLNNPNDLAKYQEWQAAMADAERHYMRMLELGASPQEARSVLPNSTKTEIMMSMNFREWRHFFSLRAEMHAHPQMKEISIPMLVKFKHIAPVMFEDIALDEVYAEKRFPFGI
jgi:thymidylate synthase (FAD)